MEAMEALKLPGIPRDPQVIDLATHRAERYNDMMQGAMRQGKAISVEAGTEFRPAPVGGKRVPFYVVDGELLRMITIDEREEPVGIYEVGSLVYGESLAPGFNPRMVTGRFMATKQTWLIPMDPSNAEEAVPPKLAFRWISESQAEMHELQRIVHLQQMQIAEQARRIEILEDRLADHESRSEVYEEEIRSLLHRLDASDASDTVADELREPCDADTDREDSGIISTVEHHDTIVAAPLEPETVPAPPLSSSGIFNVAPQAARTIVPTCVVRNPVRRNTPMLPPRDSGIRWYEASTPDNDRQAAG